MAAPIRTRHQRNTESVFVDERPEQHRRVRRRPDQNTAGARPVRLARLAMSMAAQNAHASGEQAARAFVPKADLFRARDSRYASFPRSRGDDTG